MKTYVVPAPGVQRAGLTAASELDTPARVFFFQIKLRRVWVSFAASFISVVGRGLRIALLPSRF
jgi:hypothetical protein